MNELAKELLEDIHPKDFIRVRFGTANDQITVEGTVIKWSERLLTICKRDGTYSKINLDDLRSLDIVADPEEHSPEQSHSQTLVNQEYRIMRKTVPLNPAEPYVFDPDSSIHEVRKQLKSCSQSEFKKAMGGVLDSISMAVKNHDMTYKYHDLRAKLMHTWRTCSEDVEYETFYFGLGILSILAKDYDFAMEPLVRAHRFTLAAYAAEMGGKQNEAHCFTVCALLSAENLDINQYISEICVKRRDPAVLEELLRTYRGDDQVCEKIASCALSMFQAAEGQLSRDIGPYDSAQDMAECLVNSIPKQWKTSRSVISDWKEYQSYSYPIWNAVPDHDEELQIGYVEKFNSEGKWGFISGNYFYISQVYDDSEEGLLLRKMLEAGLWQQLEVSYRLGKSPMRENSTAAMEIELTEKGFRQAQNLLEAGQGTFGGVNHGFIEYYSPLYQKGRVQYNEIRYNFSLDNIIDPYLKKYYSESFSTREQNVTFTINGKYANNISWDDPAAEDKDLYSAGISETEIEQWQKKLAELQEQRQQPVMDGDPYAQFFYQGLEEIEADSQNASEPVLTWDIHKKHNEEDSKDPKGPGGSEGPEDTDPGKNGGGKIYSPEVSDATKALAEQARKKRKNGNLEESARLFAVAMEDPGFDEKIFSDYISILQQMNRLDEAMNLLEQYQTILSPAKLLNLKISVLDKKKDFIALEPLYEEAYNSAPTIALKSHYLVRLIDTYVRTGQYEKALEACKRWDMLYRQNRYGTDAEKLMRASANVMRHRAYCYFFRGNMEEAKELATSLIRVNPADNIANSILDGSLERMSAEGAAADTEKNSSAEDGSYEDDEGADGTDNGDVQTVVCRFVKTKIQQADISAVLKSKNLRDGRYIGSVEDGLKDVETLIGRTRIPVRTRCESLFAACRLLEQIEQNEDCKRSFLHRKLRLSGRAMAAWGDVMATQAHQLDSTRMAYLYALKTLTANRNGSEQGWVDSYNRYLKSFFLAQNGQNSLEEYIAAQNNSSNRDGANTDILKNGDIQPVLLPEFLVGILLMVEALKDQANRLSILLDDFYEKNKVLRTAICRQLSVLLEEEVPENISRMEFGRCIRQASACLRTRTAELGQVLTGIGNILMKGKISLEQMRELEPDLWSNFLTATDFSRLKRIYYIVSRSQEYYSSGEFESRADCLRAVLLEVNDLQQAIQKEPTDVSYDIFLPVLDMMALKMTDRQTDLYQSYLPRISITETIPPFRTPSGQIQIQLTVENNLNYQSAERFRITGVNGPEVIRYESDSAEQTIRGGEDTELGVKVTINRQASESGSFTAVVSYSYRCSDAPQNVITRTQEASFTFVIRDENFVALVNPFSAFEEQVMEDETMFYGRSTQISHIQNMIRLPNGRMNYGRAVGMYGQTRTGKTSLLYHLKNRLMKTYGDDLLIWDLGNLGEMQISNEHYRDNLCYFLLELADESLYENECIRTLVEQEHLEVPLAEIAQYPKQIQAIFATYTHKLNKIFRRENKMVIIIADEFTYLHGYIREGKISGDIMEFWKAFLQNNCFALIFAGQDDMPEFIREYPNNFGCMELLRLNYLAEEDTKKLIREPLETANRSRGLFRDDGCIDEIYRLTAGSPYLTIILCSKLVSYLNEKGAYMVTRGIIQDFLRTKVLGPNSFLLEKHFEPQIDERGHMELHEGNKEILLSIARLSQTSGYAELTDIKRDLPDMDGIEAYINRLLDRNVLAKEGRDRYWIQVKLLEKWLIDTKGV